LILLIVCGVATVEWIIRLCLLSSSPLAT